MRGTLVMAAVATQQLELIELLLSAGASVHVTDAFGCTALSAASCPLDHQVRVRVSPNPNPNPNPNANPNPNQASTLPRRASHTAHCWCSKTRTRT